MRQTRQPTASQPYGPKLRAWVMSMRQLEEQCHQPSTQLPDASTRYSNMANDYGSRISRYAKGELNIRWLCSARGVPDTSAMIAVEQGPDFPFASNALGAWSLGRKL